MDSVRLLCAGSQSPVADALAADERFRVTRATTVEETLARLDDGHPDCLVAAHELPDATGLDLFDAVRARDETVPFVLVDGTGTATDDAVEAGVTDYVRPADCRDDAAVLAHRIVQHANSARRRRDLDRSETVVAALGDPVYALDDEGRFTYVNDAFLELVDHDRSTVLGSGPELIKSPEAVAEGERQLGRLLSGSGPDTMTFEVSIQPGEGDPVRCEDHMGVLRGPNGQFRGSAGTLRDIAERAEREQRIREERQLLERSLNALDDLYYLLDPSGAIERCNDRVRSVTGYDDPTGVDVLEFFEDEARDRVADAIGTAIESGTARVEAELVTADGRHIPYEFTGTRLLDDDGDLRGVIGVGRDITDRVAFETELERNNERLEEFVSVVSHDLRNPLNVAKGRTDLIRQEYDGEHIDAVARSLDRMDTLIDDLLTLAREGESPDDAKPVDLRTVVEASREPLETGGGALDIRTDKAVLADESRLRQLVENLFRNAVEHGSTSSRPGADGAAERGGPDLTVTIGTLADGDADGFYVADDGPGIPPDKREQVFENGYSSTREGTGFGLAIVESVASAHGWETELTESEAGGARFEFRGVEFAD